MNALLVVDTDVVSFLFKGDTRAEAYRQHLEGHTFDAIPGLRVISAV